MTTYLPFLPIQVEQLTTSACLNLVKKIQRSAVTVPFCAEPIDTAYVCVGEGTPLLLLHGFDSCLLEFSQLIPFLSQDYEVYAFDLLGFGFEVAEAVRRFVAREN